MIIALIILLLVVAFAAGYYFCVLKQKINRDNLRTTDYKMTLNGVEYKYYMDSPVELVIKKKDQPAFHIEFNSTSEYETLLFELKELGDKWHREMVSDYWNEIIFGE